MKTSELIEKLKNVGYQFRRHGRRHDIWNNPNDSTKPEVQIPRHAKDVKKGMASDILKQAGAK